MLDRLRLGMLRHMRIAMWVLALCVISGILMHRARMDSRLLRSDPGTLPANAALMGFARGSGEKLFASYCAGCHGNRGRGDPRRAIPNLTDDDWLYGSGSVADIEQVIEYGIRSGHPKAWNLAIMPAYGKPVPSSRDPSIPPLGPAQIRDLVEFLTSQEGLPADAAGVTRGAALFSGRGGCYDCHAPDARGDPGIGAPNLSDHVTLYGGGRESLTLSLTYGRQGVCPAFIKKLAPAQIRKIALYTYFLSHPGRSEHVDR